MFVILTQARTKDPVAISISNIRELYPDSVFQGHSEISGTAVILYRGDSPWLVAESVYEVVRKCEEVRHEH